MCNSVHHLQMDVMSKTATLLDYRLTVARLGQGRPAAECLLRSFDVKISCGGPGDRANTTEVHRW